MLISGRALCFSRSMTGYILKPANVIHITLGQRNCLRRFSEESTSAPSNNSGWQAGAFEISPNSKPSTIQLTASRNRRGGKIANKQYTHQLHC